MEEESNEAVVTADDDEEEIPPLKKKGMPRWVFLFIRFMLRLCPLDAYVCFPFLLAVIAFSIAALVGVVVTIVEGERQDIAIYITIAILCALAMIVWLRWAHRNPRVPQEDDVARFCVSDGVDNWPRAPVAPVRGELVAKGGSWFKDRNGRRLLLRGINCAGGTKMPSEPADQRATHLENENFFNYKGVSFVGRPFPLSEADLHLGRLRAMGLTFLRFLVTWEAVEHDGPKIYDEEYLQYLRDVVRRCSNHGISVFIDFHQDVWSRWTGGDGAPAWTLEKCGFALDKLGPSAAALTQQNWKGNYPKMVWNSNNSRLAAGTMWTLFFAGDDFAPKTLIDGMPVQQYLQSHFLGAMGKVAEKLREEANVVGFDVLNEPSVGFVGVKDVRDIGPNMYYVGWRVDPWSAMKMGAGETCSVDYFASFMIIDGKRELNEDKVCSWQNGPTSCVWHANGVWKMHNGEPRLLKPFYFATNPRTGQPIDFLADYGIPFWRKAAKAVRAHIPDAIIFVEPILDMTDPGKEQKANVDDETVGAGFVWAAHYYDGMTLMTKSFSRYIGIDSVTQRPAIGIGRIHKTYAKGMSTHVSDSSAVGTGGSPVLIGECGIPFDLGGRERRPVFFGGHGPKTAFETGDFNKCTHALNRTMGALEHSKLSFTIWCYEPDNTNQYGDGWNGEDLSLFSRDQIFPGDEDNLFAGGRSLLALIRPYPTRIAGDVVRFSFSLYRKDRRFTLVFKADRSLPTRDTEVFIPKYQYPHGVNVVIKSGGGHFEVDWESQTLTYTHSEASLVCHIEVTKILAPAETTSTHELELE